MQTFLPYADFGESARALDKKRLVKQVVEAFQILNCLSSDDPNRGWQNHPAVLMWKGYERALVLYYRAMFSEALRRGVRFRKLPAEIDLFSEAQLRMPLWLGRENMHASHRSNLLRKSPEHYGQMGWTEEPNLPYVWPVRKETSA